MRLLAGLVATALLLHEEQIPDTEAEAATNAIVENAGLAPGSSHCTCDCCTPAVSARGEACIAKMTEPCLELKYCVPVKPKVLAVDPGTSVELLRFCASECDVQLTGGCSEPDTLAGLTYNTLEPTIAPDVGLLWGLAPKVVYLPSLPPAEAELKAIASAEAAASSLQGEIDELAKRAGKAADLAEERADNTFDATKQITTPPPR
jgi:hypothetical protein